ncbi:hypothetical protein MNEG_5036 [Monoraphidium neglectum]|uniref:Uncharacterized protein n=1 Tax=Monoraphidium neglectum TaxID=145388 RepID=A0A0D2MR70_9CHLO|nr:hypothetical protein MNEG_5036 [Monoraphidium neglectum]KIZ02927.1 hypothetical protein MNEG_5036 [Monoraphidium neglectum]|eukprot:XP_013901946.1 hypothetical protein MNEG_5036 [Monoraphidium neglectum]
MLKTLFGSHGAGGPTSRDDDDSEVEALLQRVSESRHAAERRDALARLRDMLQDSPQAQQAVGVMGLPVLLAVVTEDRDDTELTRTALEALALSFGGGEGGRASGGGTPAARAAARGEGPPPPGVMNAELFARSPDNVRLLLSLLEDEPVGVDDFYCR